MSVTTEPEFYDAAMTEDGAPAMLALSDSPWLPVYEEAAGWVPPGHPVVDLGCGTGRFGALLARRGHAGGYTGVDFSAWAIAEARRYLPGHEFTVADLRAWQPARERPGNTSYVCLEVLEHLADDRELVSRIPVGHELVLSVPSYESEAHLRTFASPADAIHRYERWLTFRRWSLITLGAQRAIHVFHASRRLDSW